MHDMKQHRESITAWLIVVLLCSGASSQAAEVPEPGDRDQRVRYVTYQKDEVTKVTVRRGVVTRIILGDDERIVIAGSGFLADCAKQEAEWCIRADVGTNQVWVKPKDQATHNNLEIRTDKRDYSLEFTVVGDHRTGRIQHAGQGSRGQDEPMYRVIFRHPLIPPNPAAMTAMQTSAHRAKHAREKTDLLHERLESFTPEPRNWSYSMEVLTGGDDIAPALVFDDGRFTYFLFPPNREIPAIFYFSPLGEETRNLLKSVLHHAYDHRDTKPQINRSHWAKDARTGPRIGRSGGHPGSGTGWHEESAGLVSSHSGVPI